MWYVSWTLAAVGFTILVSAGYFRWKRRQELAAAASRLYNFWNNRLVAPYEFVQCADLYPRTKDDWRQAIADYQLVRSNPSVADLLPAKLWEALDLYPWFENPAELEKMSA